MNIKPIKTKADYQAALAEVGELMNAKLGTAEGDKLDVLVSLIEAYESQHFPMSSPIRSKPSSSAWSNPG